MYTYLRSKNNIVAVEYSLSRWIQPTLNKNEFVEDIFIE